MADPDKSEEKKEINCNALGMFIRRLLAIICFHKHKNNKSAFFLNVMKVNLVKQNSLYNNRAFSTKFHWPRHVYRL